MSRVTAERGAAKCEARCGELVHCTNARNDAAGIRGEIQCWVSGPTVCWTRPQQHRRRQRRAGQPLAPCALGLGCRRRWTDRVPGIPPCSGPSPLHGAFVQSILPDRRERTLPSPLFIPQFPYSPFPLEALLAFAFVRASAATRDGSVRRLLYLRPEKPICCWVHPAPPPIAAAPNGARFCRYGLPLAVA